MPRERHDHPVTFATHKHRCLILTKFFFDFIDKIDHGDLFSFNAAQQHVYDESGAAYSKFRRNLSLHMLCRNTKGH